ncbi:MAG: HAD-IIA family hydrolase [Clostridia bacterium]|jgi:HAD superfamily hydrolase (TIGR01450 family)|nr:HAD-IIA family hydrolase [Clostridia bacterium]MBQ4243718.1 HAD-IIA family hydrolase [Clostridia bacterium]
MGVFDKTKYFIVDMDGTFYLDGNIIPGSDEFLQKARETGRDFYFFTNNSSNNVEVCRKKLADMGFPVDENRVIVSSAVAIDYLNRNHPGKRIFLLGNERLTKDCADGGLNLVTENPDIVLLGFDTTLTYQKMWDAVRFLDAGALYYATHPDRNCPTADGYKPDTGSMIEMFAASTGRRPTVLGKPMTATVDYITRLLGCKADELAFIGDRLETDIAIGFNHSIPCALVFSGVTTPEMYEKSEIRASVTAENMKSLTKFL